MQNIMFNGPWTVNGLVLRLSMWHAFYQPIHAKLSTAAIWIQLHHLPVEFMEGEILETIVTHFARLLKIDYQTVNLSRAKYARVCVKLDLLRPLQRDF